MAHEYGGFNIFRRFRLTHLETSGCPETLKHFWSGHAQKHVSERYVKLDQNRDFRLHWAEKIGLGFELPGAQLGNLGNCNNSEILPKLLKELVDGRGFEPPASSLRTMRSPS